MGYKEIFNPQYDSWVWLNIVSFEIGDSLATKLCRYNWHMIDHDRWLMISSQVISPKDSGIIIHYGIPFWHNIDIAEWLRVWSRVNFFLIFVREKYDERRTSPFLIRKLNIIEVLAENLNSFLKPASKGSYDEFWLLFTFLRGRVIWAKPSCHECHGFGHGPSIGPNTLKTRDWWQKP